MGYRFLQGHSFACRSALARMSHWSARALAVTAMGTAVETIACYGTSFDPTSPPTEPLPTSGGCAGGDINCAGADAGLGPLALPSLPTGPRPDFGATVSLATSPPAVIGGTLLVTQSGTIAVAADPDRDQIYLVDLGTQIVTTLPLEPGDEPGRLAEDGNGQVYVALRRGGALVTVDVAALQIVARRPVCPAPRGVTYDPTTDNVYVACNGGELVTMPASGGVATRTLSLGPDLRDVVVQGSSLFVSRLRSAEVIQLDSNGSVEDITTPPVSNTLMEPAVAWRMIGVPPASSSDTEALAMVHQRAQPQPVSTQPGGYGQSGSGCMSSIVESTVTVFRENGSSTEVDPIAAPIIPAAVLPVDLSVSSDGQTFGVVAAGNGKTPMLPSVYFLARTPNGGLVANLECATDMARGTVPGQATAVALTTHRVAWVQTREPAALFQVTAQPSGEAIVTASIPLSSESREDTGHSIMHSNSGAFVACASCHPEAGDDGRTWRFVAGADGGGIPFDGINAPARRTQSLRGTLSGTAPYHWEGDLTNISSLAHEVFVTRMDGQSLTTDQDKALETWLFAIPAPITSPPADPASAARGQVLFESPAVGCLTCHSGAKLTNNQTMNAGVGGAFQVPSLIGVSWRAPYLHDGRAPQLVDRFNPSLGGGDQHGQTSQLTTSQIDDLVQYLETL